MTRVVIVGGGVVGLMCAARLARRGAQVTLLEGEQEHFSPFGPTTSASAAGMIAPLSDEEVPPALQQLCFASYDLWRAWRADSVWGDGVRFDGGVIIVRDEVEAEALIARARELGRRASALSAGQARKRLGVAARLEHAVLLEEEGIADPNRVLSGLCMEARRYGAQVRFGCDVESASAHTVSTYEDGVFEADHVLLCPGVWANDPLKAAAPALKHIRPAKGILIPVALEQPLGAILRAPDFYLTRRLGDTVLGSTMEYDTYQRVVDPMKVEALLSTAEALLPGEVRQDGSPWTGLRPMSPDGAPMIGKSGGPLVACGHGRNGWLLAPLTAEIICAHVFGEDLAPEWILFDPPRFD